MTSSTVTMIAQEGVAWSVQAVGVQISIQLSAAELILQLSTGCCNSLIMMGSLMWQWAAPHHNHNHYHQDFLLQKQHLCGV